MVAFDAVGPSATGQITASPASSSSWSHNNSGNVLIVGVAVGKATPDTGISISSVTYNNVPMTGGAVVHSGNITAGFLQVFTLLNPAAGTNTVAVTLAGGTARITGGSISVSAAGSIRPQYSANTPAGTTTATATSSGSTSGSLIVAFVADGSGTTSATSPSTSRFLTTPADLISAAGNSAGATSPGTGSSVTTAWSISSDDFAVIGVEILPAVSVPSALPPPAPAWHPGAGLPGLPGGTPFATAPPPAGQVFTSDSGSIPGAADMAGAGSIDAALATVLAPADLAGTGSLTAPSAQQAGATLSGGGSISSAAVQRAGTTLAAAGSVGNLDVTGSPATLGGAGAVTTAAVLSAPATLSGTGSIAAPSAQQAPATLSGTGSITALATQRVTATLAGTGSITGTGSSAGAGLGGAGSINTPAILLAPATLSGAGSVTAPSAQQALATLAGTGSLSALAIQRATAALAGTGSIVGSTSSSSSGAGTLGGAGALNAPAVQLAPAILTGTGSLTARSIQLALATLAGTGSLTAAGTVSEPAPKLATLTDSFGASSIDSSKWTSFTNNGATITESGGTLNCAIPGTTNAWAGLVSGRSYDLTSSSAYLAIPAYANFSNSYAVLALCPQGTPPSGSPTGSLQDFSSGGVPQFMWALQSGQLGAVAYSASSNTQPANLAFDPVQHKFWRIREAGGIVNWDTSPDGLAWVNQGSVATSFIGAGLAVSLFAWVYAWNFSGGSGGTTRFADFNTPAVVPDVKGSATATVGEAASCLASVTGNSSTASVGEAASIRISVTGNSSSSSVTESASSSASVS